MDQAALDLAKEKGFPSGWKAYEMGNNLYRCYGADGKIIGGGGVSVFPARNRAAKEAERKKAGEEIALSDPFAGMKIAMNIPGWKIQERTDGKSGFTFTSPDGWLLILHQPHHKSTRGQESPLCQKFHVGAVNE